MRLTFTEPDVGTAGDGLATILHEFDDEENKLPPDAVNELNARIATSTLSPFDRFRSPRGVLSVYAPLTWLTVGD